MNWKRIVAREFLLLAGIVMVGVLTAGGLWVRNGLLERKAARTDKALVSVRGEIRRAERMIDSIRIASEREKPILKAAREWKPPADAVPTKGARWPPPPPPKKRDPFDALADDASVESSLRPLESPLKSGAERYYLAMDSVWKSCRTQLVAMQSDLESKSSRTQFAILSWEVIGEKCLWVVLVLVGLAYPIRFFVLGVQWSVRTLRDPR